MKLSPFTNSFKKFKRVVPTYLLNKFQDGSYFLRIIEIALFFLIQDFPHSLRRMGLKLKSAQEFDIRFNLKNLHT